MTVVLLDFEGTPGANISPNWSTYGFTSGLVDGSGSTAKFTNGAGKVFSGSTALEFTAGSDAASHGYCTKSGLNTPQVAVDCCVQMPSSPVVSGDWQLFSVLAAGGVSIAKVIINGANKIRLVGSASTTIFTLTAAHPTDQYIRFKTWFKPGTTTSNGSVQFEVWNTVTGLKVHGATVYNSTTANLGIVNIDTVRFGHIGGGGFIGTHQIDTGAYDVSATGLMPDQPTTNIPPVAAFSSSVSGADVDFNASASSDTDGTVASYAWTFGDGSTGTGVTPSHSYAAVGTYTVGLIVTDNDGDTSANTTHSVVISTVPTGVVIPIYTNVANGGASSISTLDIPCNAGIGAQPNDIISGCIVNERGTALPTLTAASGVVNVPFQLGGTNIGMTSFWKRLTAADIALGYIRATYSPIRRAISGFEILRGSLNPVYGAVMTVVGDAGGAAPSVLTAPDITPALIDSYIQVQYGVVPLAAPYVRTFSPPATWTELFEGHAGGTIGVEPYVTALRKQVSATTAITGPAITPSDVTTHMAWLATIAAFAPSPTPLPISDAGDDLAVIEPDAFISLDGSGSSGKAPLTYAWRRISGPIPFSWSSQTVMSPTIQVRGAMTTQTLVLGLIVTDADGLAAGEDTISITILPASEGYWNTAGVLLPYVDAVLAPAIVLPPPPPPPVGNENLVESNFTGNPQHVLDGTNIVRDTDQMIRYTRSATQVVTPTNIFGVEVTIDSETGLVTEISDRHDMVGSFGTPIPEGSYVLSGHGRTINAATGQPWAGQWLLNNAQPGRTITLSIGAPPPPPPPPPSGSDILAADVVSVWNHAWEGPQAWTGYPTNVKAQVNLICLAMAQSASAGTGNLALFNKWGSSLATGITAAKAAGCQVVLGIGGSNDGGITITSTTQADQAFNSIAAIKASYGVTGLDVDLEPSGSTWTQSALVYLIDRLKTTYGPSFIIGITPGMYDPHTAKWMSLIGALGAARYDYVAPMLYDFPEANSASALSAVAIDKCNTLAAAGVPNTKMILGFMCKPPAEAYPNSSSTVAITQAAYAAVKAVRPDLRGCFIWEDKIMVARSWDWVLTMGPVIKA